MPVKAVTATVNGDQRLGYVRSLDGLRGFAVLVVISFHAFNWPRNGGYLGVGLFFVLSGFLITTLLLEEFAKAQTIRLRQFYRRRALRLFPLLYLVLIMVTCSIPFMTSATDRSHYGHSLLWCALYAGDFYGLTGHFHELAPATAHIWSLAVEEQFYLVWPALLLFLLVKKRDNRVLLRYVGGLALIAILIRGILLASGKTIWTLPPTHGDALLAGCGLAILRREGLLMGLTYQRARALTAVVLSTLALAICAPLVRPTIGLGAGYSLIALLGVGLVLVAVRDSALSHLLANRLLVYCGRISYGLYIIHPIVFVALDAEMSVIPRWPRALLAVGVTFLLAAASRRWFEQYFLSLKRRFESSSPPGNSSKVVLSEAALGRSLSSDIQS